MKHLIAAAAGWAFLTVAVPAMAFDNYHLKQEISIPSGDGAWDYLVHDGARLFIGHRPEGLQVLSTDGGTTVTPVADTKGSNGATLMPDLGLGVSHNGDGTLTVFGLADLKVQRRIKVGEELDSSRYDPFTKRLAVFGAPAEDKKTTDVVVFQAPAMDRIGVINAGSNKLENSAVDGSGSVFVAAQDLNMLVKLDLRDMKVAAAWPTTGCRQPTGVAFDAANRRLMIGCRGEYTDPVLIVMNADTGAIVFKTPIGPGNDGVVYDAARKRVFAANGVGANLVVIEQTGPDSYRLEEVVGTRPSARTIALDEKTGDIFTAAAEQIFDASKKNLTAVSPFYPNVFVKQTFKVLVYGR